MHEQDGVWEEDSALLTGASHVLVVGLTDPWPCPVSALLCLGAPTWCLPLCLGLSHGGLPVPAPHYSEPWSEGQKQLKVSLLSSLLGSISRAGERGEAMNFVGQMNGILSL